jgi:hypothetical protein
MDPSTSYDKLFDYKISLALVCKTCGTEWVPSTRNAAYSAGIEPVGDDTSFKAAIRIMDYGCPVCNAHESVIEGFRRSQAADRRGY